MDLASSVTFTNISMNDRNGRVDPTVKVNQGRLPFNRTPVAKSNMTEAKRGRTHASTQLDIIPTVITQDRTMRQDM
jgi:hypothetical protein